MTCTSLPSNYEASDYICLRADKKRFRLLNALSFLIGAVLVLLGWLWHGFAPLMQLLQTGFDSYYLWLLLLIIGILLQTVLHQEIHGILMRIFSGLPSQFGRKGLLLTSAGNDGFFCRKHYLWIAAAPVASIGFVLAVLTVLFGGAWFWLFLCLQIYNLGSSVGDYFYFFKALRLPKTTLFQDDGAGVSVFSEAKK